MNPNWSKFRVWSEWRNHRRERAVLLLVEKSDGAEFIGKLEFSPLDPDRSLKPEEYSVPGRAPIDGVNGQDFLQAILDHAWSEGLRPVGFLDTPNEMAAVRAHLQDMRSLVFKTEPLK